MSAQSRAAEDAVVIPEVIESAIVAFGAKEYAAGVSMERDGLDGAREAEDATLEAEAALKRLIAAALAAPAAVPESVRQGLATALDLLAEHWTNWSPEDGRTWRPAAAPARDALEAILASPPSDPASVSGRPAPVVPDELRALSEAATPGTLYTVDQPWGDGTWVVAGSPDPHAGFGVADCAGAFDRESEREDAPEAVREVSAADDAAFLAAAANHVRTLLAATPSRRADTPLGGGGVAGAAIYTEAENEESYKIGHRDGYEEGVQDAAMRVGLDGEYGVSPDPERHVPDAPTMLERIAERVEVLAALAAPEPAAGGERINFAEAIQQRWDALVGPAHDAGSIGWKRRDLCAEFASAIASVLARASGKDAISPAAYGYAVQTWGDVWVENEADSLREFAILSTPSEAGAAGEGWRFDMEAAPRDSSSVLVAVESLVAGGDPVVGEAYFDGDNGGWWWAGESYGDYHTSPIHENMSYPYAWKPLDKAPPPPATPRADAPVGGA